MGELQQSRHDSSKVSLSPHCCCLLMLSLCYHAKGPVYNFRTNHDQDHLRIGCGWYYQQQHILIIILDPGDLKVDLHKPKVRDGSTPIPPIPITDLGVGTPVPALYRTGNSHWRLVNQNQLVPLSPAHQLSLGPH